MSAIRTSFAATPEPPYYAVIFTTQRGEDTRGYEPMAERMIRLAASQPGFLGVESVRGTDGFGITVSYWATEQAIAVWKAHWEHQAAQEAGKRVWYPHYEVRVAKVERAYGKTSFQPGTAGFEIKIDDLSGAQIRELLTEHLRSLAEVTPPESRHALNLDALRGPDITFWSVWQGHEVVGCGALKELDVEHGEIKSMRTAPSHLRKGVGAAVLGCIMAEAKRRGYRRLSLETGAMPYFAPAHSLYRRFGFATCPPFHGYTEDPNSVFMTREL
jgi:putative acetyltransferase